MTKLTAKIILQGKKENTFLHQGDQRGLSADTDWIKKVMSSFPFMSN